MTRLMVATGGAVVAAAAAWLDMYALSVSYFTELGVRPIATQEKYRDLLPAERLLPVAFIALAAAVLWVLVMVLRERRIMQLATAASAVTALALVVGWPAYAYIYGVDLARKIGAESMARHDWWQMYRPTVWALLVLVHSIAATVAGMRQLRRSAAPAASAPL